MPERLARGVRKMTDSHEHENHQVTASSVTGRYVKSRVNNSPAATMGSTNPDDAHARKSRAYYRPCCHRDGYRPASSTDIVLLCIPVCMLELCVGMICGSIPTLRPLVLRWQRKDSKDEKYLRPSKSSAIKLDSYGKPSPKVSLGAKSRYSITKSEKAFMPQRRKNVWSRHMMNIGYSKHRISKSPTKLQGRLERILSRIVLVGELYENASGFYSTAGRNLLVVLPFAKGTALGMTDPLTVHDCQHLTERLLGTETQWNIMSSDQSTKPPYGLRLLPQVLDDLARSKPERVFASVPKTFELKDDFREVTVLQLSRSVDRLARWLEECIGRSSTFETIAYLGLPDLRYTIVFLAAVKCGYKVLFPSPRNTAWINNSLLEQTQCAPKPIIMHYATFGVVDNDRNLPRVPGRRNLNFSLSNFGADGGFFFSSFPPFHLGGFMAFIVLPICSSESSLVLGPANKPSTGQTAAEVLRRFDLKALFCPPNIFEQLLQEPDAIEHAKKLDFVLYAGGPLTNATGNALSKVTDLCQFYGSTETIPRPLFGADMQPSVNDAYKLLLHRDSKYEGIRGLDCKFPGIEEWRTKTYFDRIRSSPTSGRFHGRLDDIIVLSDGEKFNPVPSEAIINSHPLVSAALIVGQGRFQAALLIEPVKTDKRPTNVADELWPTVDKANTQAQSHGRIIRTMIAIADPSKPFKRAGKDTVIRKLTAEKFSEEITALYSGGGVGNIQGSPRLDNSNNSDSVQAFVREAVAFSFPMDGIKVRDDLYVHGLDSLKPVEITARLQSRSDGHRTSVGEGNDKTSDRAALMAGYVQKYTKSLCARIPEDRCIVLTGSTGSLGRNLLRQLFASPRVTKIYCLDRNSNASNKHSDTLADRNLSDQQDKARVEFLQVDYSLAKFGLFAETYQKLLEGKFQHSLESFEPTHIRGVGHLVEWQLHSENAPEIIFISSTSSVSRWPKLGNNGGLIPEDFIEDHHAAPAMGYAESKNVAEHILYEASKPVRLSSVILCSLGCLPTGIPDIDWIPVDSLASSIAEISLSPARLTGAIFFNLVNHNLTPWESLLETLQAHLGCEVTVPLQQWIERLERLDATDPKVIAHYPAIKILDFFQSLAAQAGLGDVRYSTQKAVAASETMADLPAIGPEAMKIWLDQWGY
ncbi:MAG: hypothetical protein Q9211_003115 [Gyalolechia sp. 1 TL-2023]